MSLLQHPPVLLADEWNFLPPTKLCILPTESAELMASNYDNGGDEAQSDRCTNLLSTEMLPPFDDADCEDEMVLYHPGDGAGHAKLRLEGLPASAGASGHQLRHLKSLVSSSHGGAAAASPDHAVAVSAQNISPAFTENSPVATFNIANPGNVRCLFRDTSKLNPAAASPLRPMIDNAGNIAALHGVQHVAGGATKYYSSLQLPVSARFVPAPAGRPLAAIAAAQREDAAAVVMPQQSTPIEVKAGQAVRQSSARRAAQLQQQMVRAMSRDSSALLRAGSDVAATTHVDVSRDHASPSSDEPSVTKRKASQQSLDSPRHHEHGSDQDSGDMVAFEGDAEEDDDDDVDEDELSPGKRQKTGASKAAAAAAAAGNAVKKGGARKGSRVTCRNCGTTATPQWRSGPEGPRTLCNACGVRFKKGLPIAYWEKKKQVAAGLKQQQQQQQQQHQ